ncbi:MAG: hypothetical protein AAGF73_11130 [Actinomycetota bacterium]
MRTYQNPFRSRASEQYRDTFGFLRYVGASVLDLVPETVWDRPLIVRSASGGGKTTLLRLFTVESLQEVADHREDLPELSGRLEKLGALDSQGPAKSGFLLNLGRDYRMLAHSGASEDIASRLFLRLLDARIAAAAIRAVLSANGLSYPSDASEVVFVPRLTDEGVVRSIDRLGGARGDEIVASAQATESEIANLLDSLLPVDWSAASRGHTELYSLRLLSNADITVRNTPLRQAPLLLLDDGHALEGYQRRALLGAMLDRTVTIGRWYAERFEALPTEELLQDDTPGRDFEVLELERAARLPGRRRVNRLLHDVGNLRASRHLERYARGGRDFFEYLEDPGTDITAEHVDDVRKRALAAADGRAHFEAVIEAADHGDQLFEHAVSLRSAEILIERAKSRPQLELFDAPEAVVTTPAASSGVNAAARLFVCREQRLSYYAGEDIVVGLASQNVEQFLRICGDIFEYMLGRITLDEPPTVTAERQQLLIRRASETYWRELSARVPHSPDVLSLLHRIAQVSVAETERKTAPYPPGVNGIAISMADRARLLDPDARTRIPGADRLFEALGVAIARNVIIAEPNYSVKNTRVMVLYLNRLLCPRLYLPFQRGNFRERSITEVASWLLEPAAPSVAAEPLFEP